MYVDWSTEREKLLGETLCQVLEAANVIEKGHRVSGPNLIVAAEDYIQVLSQPSEGPHPCGEKCKCGK